MWKLLPLLAILANLILTETSARDTHTKIITTNNAAGRDGASCGKDKNSTFGCGNNCGRRCSNNYKAPVSCDEKCITNSCDCEEGYVFDDYRGHCVKPEDCSSTFTTAANPENSSISRATYRSKRAITKSSGNSSPSTEESEEGTTQNNEGEGVEENLTTEKLITEASGLEAMTGGSGMESTTRKKKKKRRRRTTASSRQPDSSTDGLDITTAGSISEATTRESRTETSTEGSGLEATRGDSGMGLTTRKGKKKRRKTTTKSSSGIETTTGSSGKESTTLRHKIKTKIHSITTTASIGNPKSFTDGSEITSEETGYESTTKESGEEITIKNSEGEGQKTTEHPDTGSTVESTEDSECGEATDTRSTAEPTEDSECGEATDHPDTGSTSESTEDSECGEATEHPNTGSTAESTEDSECGEATDTGSTAEPTEDSECGEATDHPDTGSTSESTEDSECGETTTASGEGTTGETDDSGNQTSDSTMTTTEQQSTTMRGPKDCKGKNEWYFLCAPSCPQQTCADYLNGGKCSKKIELSKCKPECRCRIGYYKDIEGNCLSTGECKRWAKSMASSTTTGNLNNQDTTAASTWTMMSTTPEPNCADVVKELFIKGNLAYTVKLLSDMSERDPDNNVLVGGASVLYLFAQLVLGAKGTVNTELLKVFNLPDTQHVCRCDGKADLSYMLMTVFKENIVLEQVRCFFPKISALLTAKYSDIEYSLFCKIYANQGYALSEDFIQRTIQLFVMGPENLNFSSSGAAQKINSDVAQYTYDHFLNYVKPRTLSSLDGLILVDAEGFQGKWEKPFDPAHTMMKNFFSPDKVEKIPTMHQKGWFLYTYSTTLNAKILKLRYRGGRFSLVIILPNFIYEIKNLLRKMENPSTTASALDRLKYEKVNVYLPKFNVSVANRLKMSSEMAGIKEIFNNSTTGLKDIGSKKPSYVGEILQKLNYAVNENGMGAKLDDDFRAPEVVPRLPKIAITHTFKADHSFLYFVKFDKIVLNAGLYVN